MAVPETSLAAWGVVGVATLGVLVRPFRLPEAVWAVAGAAALVLFGLLPPSVAWQGVRKGADVYLFLTGMMLLAELARREGFFDWLAGVAAGHAKGSAARLFVLVYAVGTVVTVFLSNDATAVVLTPAVYAAARAAEVEPRPYLLVCAFIANAASFVLPVSNPANLVVFGKDLPALADWLWRFGPASAVSIAMTFAVLRWTQRAQLAGRTADDPHAPHLTGTGRVVAAALVLASFALLAVSALGLDLGLPTLLAGLATLAVVTAMRGPRTLAALRHISWSVLPLVAGLFVFVEALDATGLLAVLVEALRAASHADPARAAWAAALATAFGSNLANNLPVGLLAGAAVGAAAPPTPVADAILIGVDLGPNLSVTGSLATILWLVALRREGERVSALEFLKLGVLAMPAALIPAVAARLLMP